MSKTQIERLNAMKAYLEKERQKTTDKSVKEVYTNCLAYIILISTDN